MNVDNFKPQLIIDKIISYSVETIAFGDGVMSRRTHAGTHKSVPTPNQSEGNKSAESAVCAWRINTLRVQLRSYALENSSFV